MPINNIPQKHSQLRLMENSLSLMLNPNNKLYKLKDLINWNDLNKEILSLIKISDRGREKKDLRMMVSLVMLQAMYNLSDLSTEKMFEENLYWQLFCGFEYVIKDNLVSESSIRRFRQTIG